MLFVTWMVTLYLENKRKRYLSFALLALTFGLLLRKNLSIFVVASVLVLIVSMLQGYKKHYLYAIVGIVTVTIIVNWLPTRIYEFRANSELGKAGDGKYNLWQRVLTVTIIGGFLFYMFWEGGSRYTLPYMVCMLPYAAKGIARFCLPTK